MWGQGNEIYFICSHPGNEHTGRLLVPNETATAVQTTNSQKLMLWMCYLNELCILYPVAVSVRLGYYDTWPWNASSYSAFNVSVIQCIIPCFRGDLWGVGDPWTLFFLLDNKKLYDLQNESWQYLLKSYSLLQLCIYKK